MGGGLSAAADGGVTQSDNVFKNNVLSYNMPVPVFDSGGGGEWVNPGTQLTSRRDRFVGNSTTNTNAMGPETGGGALYVLGCASSPPTARLEDLVAAGNHVGTPGDGSGVYDGCPSQPVTLRVSDSTIAANTGGGQIDGGDTDHLQMQNSIIAPALGTPAINGFATRAVSFSDTCRASGPKLSGAGNICADPRLKNAGAGDIHQTSKSPTRDRGSNALVPSGLSTDFEGGKRITDYQPDGKAIVDMGADETLTGTLIVRGLHVGRLRLTGKHRGTRITYSITGPARVTYTFTRLLPHRKTRGAGSFAKNAGKAGKQSVRFSGRVGHHTLAPGSYKLTVTAKNRLNNRSRKTTTKFAVVSR
jgi:hypothetical protein